MKKEYIIRNYNLEDDGEFYYKDKKYASFRSKDERKNLHVFEIVNEDDYEFVSQEVYKEMLVLLNKISIRDIKSCLLDKKAIEKTKRFMSKTKNDLYTPDFEKEVKFVRRVLTWVAMCGLTAVLSTPVVVSIMEKAPYITYEELADRIPDDNRTFSEILLEKDLLQLLDESGLKELSDKEKVSYVATFVSRCEKFNSLLTADEQEVFKYQLSNMDIRFSEDRIPYFSAEEKYLRLPENIELDYHLETTFCDMLANCYLDNGKCFVFNDFFNKDHNLYNFQYYNSLMFVRANYPEYEEALRYYVYSEKFIYYNMLLKVIDCDLEYLPFDVTIDDILDSCKDIFRNSEKNDELLGGIESLSMSLLLNNEEYSSSLSTYEKRNDVINALSDFYIKKNEDFVNSYFKLLQKLDLTSDEKIYLEEILIQELANRFMKYQTLTERLNNANDIKVTVCEYDDFEGPYYDFLQEIYFKYFELNSFVEFKKWDEFKSHFKLYVNLYKENEVPSIEEKVQKMLDLPNDKQKVKEIFHYPLSRYN